MKQCREKNQNAKTVHFTIFKMECFILELPKHFQKLSKQGFLAVHFKIGLNLKRKTFKTCETAQDQK